MFDNLKKEKAMSKLAANNARKNSVKSSHTEQASQTEQTEQTEQTKNIDTHKLDTDLKELVSDTEKVVQEVQEHAVSVQALAETLKTEQTEQTEKNAIDASVPKSVAEQIAEIRAKREQLAKEREEHSVLREKQKEELRVQREMQKELDALKAEEEELEKLKNSPITLEEEVQEVNDKYEAAFAKENTKVSQAAQDNFFIEALKACGNTVDRIGILREFWKANSSEFRSIGKEKQQKAIMRRTLNRLLQNGTIVKDGMKLTLVVKAEVAEVAQANTAEVK